MQETSMRWPVAPGLKTFEKEKFSRLFSKTMNVFTTVINVIGLEALVACGIIRTCTQKWYICGSHDSCLHCMLPGVQVTNGLRCT